MADDLDDLLDEVERKFCKNVLLTSPCDRKDDANNLAKVKETKRERGKETSRVTQENDYGDIDDFIEEIFADCDEVQISKVKTTSSSNSKVPCPAVGRKCSPVFLGGSAMPCGIATSISQRSCNRLRCTACDFRVTLFDDFEWHPSCDSLFFRNNMPDPNKLKAKLMKKRGARAYSCQCSWRTIVNMTDLRTEQELRWVCGKHET
ncbi:cilia- and flagella-associated protein 418 [Erpetoichthys calabaricus]|uniref:Cilia- and flagella-associated protein 418 n=1 Tax=Erpetoichthys calabaricus TaxID=27687 RepID=A0A8C4TJS9_ERPCA|nr:cilia- and flagella-associated protein 418 [Erpetoichthys calabaricus]